MSIAGIILLLIAGGLAAGAVSQHRKLGTLLSTKISDVSFLQSLAESLERDGGRSGTMVYYTGIKGIVQSDKPLRSELGDVSCVYYKSTVLREYEETYYQTRDGKRERRTRTSSETVSSNERSIPFELEDATGRIKVDPKKAKLITEESVSRFEPVQDSGGFSVQIGNFQLNLSGSDRHTLGYRFKEEVIPVGNEVFVMGEVSDQTGTLQISKPRDTRRFMISVKDEEELMERAEKGAKGFRIAAAVVGVIGLGLLIFGLM